MTTLVSPFLIDTSGNISFTGTITGVIGTNPITAINESTQVIDLEGSIVMPPGSYICIVTSTASAATSFWGSFQWEEIPV